MSQPTTNEEKEHFNHLADERRRVGFVPDLRRMGDNDHFYLSPYRRQALANLSLQIVSGFAVSRLQSVLPSGGKILDLGGGNGWFALELARAGYQVTSVDLSETNVEVARTALKEADLSPGQGAVFYHAGDLASWTPESFDFDAVCFNGSLHHLPDPALVLSRTLDWLKPKSWIVAAEPQPGNYGETEGIIAAALRLALSAAGAWYEPIPLPRNAEELEGFVETTRLEYANWADARESGNQSPNNNAADGDAILPLIERDFECLDMAPVHALQHRLIGGTRFPSEEIAVAFARNWIELERKLIQAGTLRAGGYFFFGRRR